MALDALGLGIGMTGAPREYTNLISQAVAGKQKQDSDQENLYQSYMKNIALDDNKYHKLVRPEANEVTEEFTKKLTQMKIENPRGWMNQVPSLFQSYKTKMTDLVTLSDQYFTFEKSYDNPNLKLYKTKEIDEVAREIKMGTDYRKIPENLKNRGLVPNDVIAWDERGSLFFIPTQSYDFTKDAQNFRRINASTHSSILNYNPDFVKQKKTESIFTTRAELNDFAAKNNLTPLQTANIQTLEDNFNRFLQEDQVERQLIDKYKRQNPDGEPTDKNLFDFYVKMVKPSIGTTYDEAFRTVPKGTNVTVNTGQDNTGKFSGWNTAKIGDKDVDMTFLSGGDFKINTSFASESLTGMLGSDLEPVLASNLANVKETIINEKGAQGEITEIVKYKDNYYAKTKFPKGISGSDVYHLPLRSVYQVISAKLDKQSQAELEKMLKGKVDGTPR